MSVVSLSLDEETERRIQEIEQNTSFDSRSELVRKAISELHTRAMNPERLEGRYKASLTVEHSHSAEEDVNEIMHGFSDLVITQLHSRLNEKRCLEVMIVEGEIEEILEMERELEGSSATEKVGIRIHSS
jgi:CopG family nickel-responsive transcriptional regulator